MLQKHSFSGVGKTPQVQRNPRCSKNIYRPGAEKTPWMLRKHRVLKKHYLDAEKVPDARKTPFRCWKNPQPVAEGWCLVLSWTLDCYACFFA